MSKIYESVYSWSTIKKDSLWMFKPHRTVLINNKTTLLILWLYLRAFTFMCSALSLFASSMKGRFSSSLNFFHSLPSRLLISELCILGLSWAILRLWPRDHTMKAFIGRLTWSAALMELLAASAEAFITEARDMLEAWWWWWWLRWWLLWLLWWLLWLLWWLWVAWAAAAAAWAAASAAAVWKWWERGLDWLAKVASSRPLLLVLELELVLVELVLLLLFVLELEPLDIELMLELELPVGWLQRLEMNDRSKQKKCTIAVFSRLWGLHFFGFLIIVREGLSSETSSISVSQ